MSDEKIEDVMDDEDMGHGREEGYEEPREGASGDEAGVETTAIVRKTTTDILKVYYTQAELLELGEKAGQLGQQRLSKENDMKAVAQQYKSELAKLDAEINENYKFLVDRYHFDKVDCEVVIDYEAQTYTKTRMDTGEVVSSRPLRHDEMQMSLLKEG